MYVPTQEEVQTKVQDALRALEELNVDFRGPYTTPGKRRIYFIDDCILTESEVAVLYEGGHFGADNIHNLLRDLKYLQRRQPGQRKPINESNPQNRRRSQRVMLQLKLLIRAEMAAGKLIQTQAFTVMVNAHGGLLESPLRMTVGQRMTLINPQTGKEVVCRVVRVERSGEGGFRTAFEFDHRSPQFWPIAFPPLDWNAVPMPVTSLSPSRLSAGVL